MDLNAWLNIEINALYREWMERRNEEVEEVNVEEVEEGEEEVNVMEEEVMEEEVEV